MRFAGLAVLLGVSGLLSLIAKLAGDQENDLDLSGASQSTGIQKCQRRLSSQGNSTNFLPQNVDDHHYWISDRLN